VKALPTDEKRKAPVGAFRFFAWLPAGGCLRVFGYKCQEPAAKRNRFQAITALPARNHAAQDAELFHTDLYKKMIGV